MALVNIHPALATNRIDQAGGSVVVSAAAVITSTIPQPTSVATATGTAASDFVFTGATGGLTTITTTGTGGVGTDYTQTLGNGGTAASAATANTGGKGGTWSCTTGTGGAATGTAGTNVGGAGGDFNVTLGPGGAASGGSSNTAGVGGIFDIVGTRAASWLMRLKNLSATGYTALDFLKSDDTELFSLGFANASAALYAGSGYVNTHNNTTSFIIGTNSTTRVTVAGTGGVTIATPDSGVALTISGGGATITGVVTLSGASKHYINDTANGGMTVGLTINQGTNTDEILAFKGSDIAHGVTGIAETDTYAIFRRASGADGGLLLRAIRNTGGANCMMLQAYSAATVNTTKDTTADGVIQLAAILWSAGAVADVGADGNLAVIKNRSTTRFIFDAEGTLHSTYSSVDTFGGGSGLVIAAGGSDITGATALKTAATAGGAVTVTITPGAHTALTAEVLDVSLAAHSVTLTDGTTIALARSVVIGATTYQGVAGGGTETVTTAIGTEFALPVQGTNCTVTNAPVAARSLGNMIIGNILSPAAGPTNTLFVSNGTAPTSTVANSVAFYSSDASADGHTVPSFYCEGTEVLATGQADSASATRVKLRINGTLVTLLAI